MPTSSENCVVGYGIAWYGMAWHGMVWYGMVWYGMAWHGMGWYESDFFDSTQLILYSYAPARRPILVVRVHLAVPLRRQLIGVHKVGQPPPLLARVTLYPDIFGGLLLVRRSLPPLPLPLPLPCLLYTSPSPRD